MRFRIQAILAATTILSGSAGATTMVYAGGPILTMAGEAPAYVEALVVTDGKIAFAGRKATARKAAGKDATQIDLKGHTLIPGFVDAHSHFTGVGLQAVSANLLPPPDGPAKSIADIQAIMRDFIATSPAVKQTGLAIGFDYDDSQLAEHRAPTRAELDAVSTTIPIMLIHQSGHLGAFNSKALAMAGVSAETPDPSGGVIQREADGKTPNGVMEESALALVAYRILPKFTAEQGLAQVAAAQAIYLANGFTTAQDGKTDAGSMALLAGAAKAGVLKIDVVSYADLVTLKDNPILRGPYMARDYTGHFRIGGVKLTFDGSPQGKTAWFTRSYLQAPAGQPATYSGYPAFPKPGEAQGWVDLAYGNNWQLLIHANGDAAIDAAIATVGAAQAKYQGTDRRTVLIHGQYIRPDQIAPVQALGIFPALFPMHTFYWGDWHRQSVAGPERAAFTSPTGSVLRRGMKFSIHSDAPVTFPNSMRVLDSAVNRTTRTGFVLGPDERISPYVALRAMTLWAAHEQFEETSKGSLETGKRADLVILDQDPLQVARAAIKDIKVIETIKDGVTVWTAGR